MIKDTDSLCVVTGIILLVLIFMNFQRDYTIVNRRSLSACSMASRESNASAKQSLSIEPVADESSDTDTLEIGVLNENVWSGEKKELSDEEVKTQNVLDEFISTIDGEKFEEHMTSGCNANITKPTYKKIIEAGATNRPTTIRKPTFFRQLGNVGAHAEARKFYAPDTEKCDKPKFDLYFNNNEMHYESSKCD